MAATVTLLGSIFDTNSGSHAVTATPQANDLIIIVAASSGNTATTVPTDNNGDSGTFALISGTNALKNTSADILTAYVRSNLIQNVASTVFTHNPGTSTGGGLAVYAVRGQGKVGAAVIRQAIAQTNQASGTPTPTFSNAPLTTNPIIGAVFNGTSPAGITARTSATRDVNLGYSTPTAGFATQHRNSGDTTAAQAWGSSSATAFSAIAIEIDATVTTVQNQSDTFPGSSLDATKWYSNILSGGSAPSVSGNAVTLTAPALTAGAVAEIESKQMYDLTGSYVLVKAVVTQVADINAEAKLVVYHDEVGNQVEISLKNGNLVSGYFIGGVYTQNATVVYNATTMAWWRIVESGGTISFQYAATPTGGIWTNIGTVAVATITFGITLVRTSVAITNQASSATAEVGVFSSFNIFPNTGNFFPFLMN